MKQPQEASQDLGLQQQNYIFKAWKDLKDSIFNVLYVLLDKEQDQEQQEPMFGLIFESGLDYFQMLAFPFDDSIMDAWNGGETLTNISSIFSKLNIMTYLPGVSFNTFLVMLYALILLIILVLIDIIYVSYSFSKKRFRFTWPLVILAKLVPLFVTIFFLPITETLLSVVRCGSQQNSDYQVMLSFPDVVCWKGWHLFHASITLLFTSLFVFISSIVALALFEPRMVSKKLTARQNSTGQVVFIMNKIICQLIFSFTPFKDKWVYSLMLFALSGWLYWTYNMKDPFYNKKASKFFRIVSSYYFWTNSMLLLSQVLGPLGFNGGLVIWISGLPFIGLIIGFEHKSNIDQLFSFNLKFKSGEQLEGHLRYVLQLLQSQEEDKNSYMLVTGYIQKHKEICIEDDCPLKMAKKLNKAASQKQDLNQKFLLQIERMYKMGIKKYPSCTRLHLSFAFFQLERLRNKNKAYEQFSYALKTDPSFEEEFIIYRFKKIIRESLENAEGSEETTDLIELIRFENHISLCEEAMISSARLHKDFWTQMKEEAPDLKKLNTIGTKITKTVNVVKQNYEQISKINSSVPEVLYCFSIYLIMVIKDNIEGKKMLELAKKVYLEKVNVSKKRDEGQEEELTVDMNTNCPVMTVSCKPGSIGKVLNLNSLFTELFGYQREQIIERNFQKILPQIFKDTHEQKMRQFIEQNEQPCGYVNTTRQGYIKLKSGFILPIEYEVRCKSSSEAFTVVFRNSPVYRNCCHLILDLNKIVKDTSVLGHVYFGLDRWTLGETEVGVQEIFGIGNFEELAHKNGDRSFEHEITFRGKKMPCTMTITEIRMKFNHEVHDGETTKGQQFTSNRLLGYYLCLSLKPQQKLEQVPHPTPENESSFESLNESQSQDIMSLYEDPNMYNILLSRIAQTKPKTTVIQKYQLTYKIKTMRLLNNELKMVYDQNANIDFDNNQHDEDQEDDLQIMKMNDDRYQEKIRAAINTKLEHQEVWGLKVGALGVGLIFVLVTVGQMLFALEVFQSHYEKSLFLQNLATQNDELFKHLTATLDPLTNFTLMAQAIEAHEVSIGGMDVMVNLGNNAAESLNIRDAFLYFYSKINEFYHVNGQINISILYENYLKNVFPVVEQMQFQQTQSVKVMKILLYVSIVIATLLSLIFLVTWIYARLKINKKKTDILLWFLDIPIPYVAYLGDNCDNYLKKFISIKEVMNKGIIIEEYPDLEDYKESKGKEEQLEEQQKARKTLILKERKLSFFSRLSCSHLKMGWVLIFGLTYSISVLFQFIALESYDNFLSDQWKFSNRNILWANSFHFSNFLTNSGYQNLNGLIIKDFKVSNVQKFQNALSEKSLNTFNSQMLKKLSNPDFSDAVNAYTSVYFSDICLYLQTQDSECSTVADASLRGGFRVYTMHINSHEVADIYDARTANEKYVSKAILSMLGIWQTGMKTQVDRASNLVSIMFYVYIFAGMIFFCIGWMIYLGKLNNQINEAIRMLNMIPFKLLSSSRKETRSFIVWIIKEANKKKHQIE